MTEKELEDGRANPKILAKVLAETRPWSIEDGGQDAPGNEEKGSGKEDDSSVSEGEEDNSGSHQASPSNSDDDRNSGKQQKKGRNDEDDPRKSYSADVLAVLKGTGLDDDSQLIGPGDDVSFTFWSY